jgi:hypothetical protein
MSFQAHLDDAEAVTGRTRGSHRDGPGLRLGGVGPT